MEGGRLPAYVSLVVGLVLLGVGIYLFAYHWILGALWVLLGINRLLASGRVLLPGGRQRLDGWLMLSGMVLILAVLGAAGWYFFAYLW